MENQNHKFKKTIDLTSKKKEESKITLKKNIKKDTKETKKKDNSIHESIEQTKKRLFSQTFISHVPEQNKKNVKSNFKTDNTSFFNSTKNNNKNKRDIKENSEKNIKSEKLNDDNKNKGHRRTSSYDLKMKIEGLKVISKTNTKILSKKKITKIQKNKKPNENIREKKEKSNSKNKLSQNKNISHSNINYEVNSTENSLIEFNLTETLKIISEIQQQFENSLKENKKPLEEIKRLIDNNLTVQNYIPLSENQKNNITYDIEKSSDLRIKNYEMAFYYIKTSLDDIKNALENIVDQEQEELNKEILLNNSKHSKKDSNDFSNKSKSESKSESKNESKNESDNENEKKNSSNSSLSKSDIDKHLITDINERKIDNIIENKNKIQKKKSSEDTDFQEGIMLENALVMPPKSSGFNYQIVKDMTRTRSKKFAVMEHNVNQTKNDDNNLNIIENKNIDNKNKNDNKMIIKENQNNFDEIKKKENLDIYNKDNKNEDIKNINNYEETKDKLQKECIIF